MLLGAFSPRALSSDRASISVGAVVQDICVIRAAAGASPIASCLHGEPYVVTLVPLDPT